MNDRIVERNQDAVFTSRQPNESINGGTIVVLGSTNLGTHARHYVEGLHLDLSRIRRIVALLQDTSAEVFVLGRVSSSAFCHLETSTACQTRALCEERGMRASGRQARGEVHSLAGYCLDSWGTEGFVQALSQTCDAAIIDSRVLFAHRKLWPSIEDRFNSDLLRHETIVDPFVRELTEAVSRAPIPIVLGGHSLVSGGLYALAEASLAPSDGGTSE